MSKAGGWAGGFPVKRRGSSVAAVSAEARKCTTAGCQMAFCSMAIMVLDMTDLHTLV